MGGAIRLYNRTTGRYLGTDGQWHATAQDLVTDATTDHVWLGIGFHAAGAPLNLREAIRKFREFVDAPQTSAPPLV